MHLDYRELHHLREENELLKSKLKKHQERQQNNDKMQQDKHQEKREQEKKEQEKEMDKSVDQEENDQEGSHQEQDNESDMYYHPLRKDDFSIQEPVGKDGLSSQEMSVYRPTGPFSFQSRANQFNF
jgi:hypothetical protein